LGAVEDLGNKIYLGTWVTPRLVFRSVPAPKSEAK
jgi:hypothetical protein